jgi:hypothetical protein
MMSLLGRLSEGLPADDTTDDADQAERSLLSHLLLYHYREAKPEWWRYFDLRTKTPIELETERGALSGLVLDTSRPWVPINRSLDWSYTFPEQEFKPEPGPVIEPMTGLSYKLLRIEDDDGCASALGVRMGSGPPGPLGYPPVMSSPQSLGLCRDLTGQQWTRSDSAAGGSALVMMGSGGSSPPVGFLGIYRQFAAKSSLLAVLRRNG